MAHGEIYVQLSVRMPDDQKVRALARYGRASRLARDMYVQMLLYCKDNLTDGHVPAEQIGILCYPDPPAVGLKDAAHLVEVGLIQATETGWLVSAFLKRNRSGQAVRDRAALKAVASAKANHTRWHVERDEVKADCEWCQVSEVGSESESDATRQGGNSAQTRRVKSQAERGSNSSGGSQGQSGRVPDQDPAHEGHERFANSQRHLQVDQHADDPTTESDRIPTGVRSPLRPESTETETETETETQKRSESSSPPPSGPESAAPEPGPPLPPEPQPDDDDDRSLDTINDRIEGRIIELLAELTGRTVDRAHASTVRRQLLDNRPVGNPLGYVASCIRGEPQRFLPTNGAPWESPVPRLPPKDPDAYDHGAAEARQLLNAKLRKGAQ